MIRVAYDVSISARVATGVGVYARSLQPALEACGVHVGAVRAPLLDETTAMRRVRNGARLVRWLVQQLGAHARDMRADVVHATTSVGPTRCRVPVVMTIHDATPVTMPIREDPAHRAFMRVFSVGAAQRAAAILAPTRSSADEICEHYRLPRARVRVVPLGVSAGFRDVPPGAVRAAQERHALTRPYVLFVGAATRRKNLPRLVAAMALVARTVPDVELVIAGPTGQDAAPLTSALPRGIDAPRMRRLGSVVSSELPGLYAGAACLAYVSEHEGFGLPIVEAMAAGTPVVTSDTSAMPEVAGGAALLVDPWCTEAIAEAVQRVLTDPMLATTLRERGRVNSRRFDWNRTATATARVYSEVCGRECSGEDGPAGSVTRAPRWSARAVVRPDS